MSVTVVNIKTFRKPGELLLKTKRKEKKKNTGGSLAAWQQNINKIRGLKSFA